MDVCVDVLTDCVYQFFFFFFLVYLKSNLIFVFLCLVVEKMQIKSEIFL